MADIRCSTGEAGSRQHCPECRRMLVAALCSIHVDESTVRHLWLCDDCQTPVVSIVHLPAPARAVA